VSIHAHQPTAFPSVSLHGQINAGALNPLRIIKEFDAAITVFSMTSDASTAVRAATIGNHNKGIRHVSDKRVKQGRKMIGLVEARDHDQGIPVRS
jgi:hypothetical protein